MKKAMAVMVMICTCSHAAKINSIRHVKFAALPHVQYFDKNDPTACVKHYAAEEKRIDISKRAVVRQSGSASSRLYEGAGYGWVWVPKTAGKRKR